MPKDNENIPLPFVGPIEPSEPPGFSAEQMIRCEECLRANPPTRVNCLYCGAPLPLTESSARFRKPTLRPPEKHQPGFNNILLPREQGIPSEVINEAASLLKLSPESLQRIISADRPLPLARAASREEAVLVHDRLQDLGLETALLADDDLGLGKVGITRVRAMSFDESWLSLQQAGRGESSEVLWSDLVLIVSGRLFLRSVEVREAKARRGENEILDTSEFIDDEAVIDLYASRQSQTWRVSARSFDFSCLTTEKTLVVNENIARLLKLIVARAKNARHDDTYHLLRATLDSVWGLEQETQSRGWRRERPGKYSLGAATVDSNESQFTLYSKLLFYFTLNPLR